MLLQLVATHRGYLVTKGLAHSVAPWQSDLVWKPTWEPKISKRAPLKEESLGQRDLQVGPMYLIILL